MVGVEFSGKCRERVADSYHERLRGHSVHSSFEYRQGRKGVISEVVENSSLIHVLLGISTRK